MFSNLLQHLAISQNITSLCALMGKTYKIFIFSNHERKNMGSIVSVHLKISIFPDACFFVNENLPNF